MAATHDIDGATADNSADTGTVMRGRWFEFIALLAAALALGVSTANLIALSHHLSTHAAPAAAALNFEHHHGEGE